MFRTLSFASVFAFFLFPLTAQADAPTKKQLRNESRAVAWFAKEHDCPAEEVKADLVEEDGLWFSYALSGCGKDVRGSFYGTKVPIYDDVGLAQVASFDMKCTALETTFLGRTQRGVSGCGVSARYVWATGGWVLNADISR